MGEAISAGLSRASAGFVLASLLAASAAAGADDVPAPPRQVREIKVRLACDEEWRAQPDWEALAKSRLAAASDIFEKRFAIRWTAVDVVPWLSNDQAVDTRALLAQVEKDVPHDDVDIVLGFSRQDRAKGADRDYQLAGVAKHFGPAAIVVGREPEPGPRWNLGSLVHELGHVLGAWHCADIGSVMWGYGDRKSTDEFDAQSAAVIDLCRDIDFSRGVDWLDEARRRRIAEIYRTGHHANSLVPYVSVGISRAAEASVNGQDAAAVRAAYRRALGEQRACVAADDPTLALCLRLLAWADIQGKDPNLDEAECLAGLAKSIFSAKGITDDPVMSSEAVLADVAWERGRFREATEIYRTVYSARLDARGASDPQTADIKSVLERRGGLGVPAKPWHEMECVLGPPAPMEAGAKFAAPASGTIHVRPVRDSDIRGAASWAEMSCAQFDVTAAQAGELSIRLREFGAASSAGPVYSMSARVGASVQTRVWFTFATHGAGATAATAQYLCQLAVVVPGAQTPKTTDWFPCDTPWNVRLRLARGPDFGPAGFLRAAAGEALLVREWDWLAEAAPATALVVRGKDVTIDARSAETAARGAKCSWRLELTFTPDAPK